MADRFESAIVRAVRRALRETFRGELRERLAPIVPAEGTTDDTMNDIDPDVCGICEAAEPVEVRGLETRAGNVNVAVCSRCARLSPTLARSHYEDRLTKPNG